MIQFGRQITEIIQIATMHVDKSFVVLDMGIDIEH